MRLQYLEAALLLGGAASVAAQSVASTPCTLPITPTCTTLRTIYVQATVTATNTFSANYVTVTSIYGGPGTLSPAPVTTTVAQPNGATPGTVEIVYNPTTITVTTLVGATTVRSSVVRTQVGTTPGLVDVFAPAYNTITTLSGAATVTSTIAQPVGTVPGTVEVFLPAYVTVTITSGIVNRVTTVNTPSGTVPGTVEVFIPTSAVVYCNLNGARTATPDPAATGTISNKGIQYGLWNSPYFDSPPFNAVTGFANYNVTDFDAAGRGAIHLGKTQRIGTSAGATTLNQPIYSDDTTQSYKTNNITLLHRGFLYARTPGIYTFTSTNPDDIILFWVGQNAISGFTRNNANIVATYPATVNTATITLAAGQYVPFRVQWANGGVPSNLQFRITSPSGQTLLDQNGSADIVTGACDGSTPLFPQWIQTP